MSIIADLGLLPEADSVPSLRVATVEVVSATADVARVRTPAGLEGFMPVTEFHPGRRWAVGERYLALQLPGESPVQFSVTRPELLEALLAGVSPEVRDGSVRVMGVARVPGVRAKVAVAATVAGVDPVASCVGRDGNRVKYLNRALFGEQVDLVAWHPDREAYLRSALQPAGVGEITIVGRHASAVAPQHQMSAAVGRGGLNSQLAGQLAGLQVVIVTPAEAARAAAEAAARAAADAEPATEASPESAAEASPESAAEASPESAAEASPESAAEASPESAAVPAAEASPESAAVPGPDAG